MDATEFHVYGAEWGPTQVVFFVDGCPVQSVPQSPSYAMHLMPGVYEFAGDDTSVSPSVDPAGHYPRTSSSTTSALPPLNKSASTVPTQPAAPG